MINLKNKKAGERVLGFYWMIVFLIITVGIVSAAVLFYGNPLDVRGIESRILSDKIIECIADKGSLNETAVNLLNADGINLQEVCGLNFADNYYDENQFYAEIIIENGKNIVFNKEHSGAFKDFCEQKSRKLPICHKEILFLLKGNDFQKVSILTSIDKTEQNAKL